MEGVTWNPMRGGGVERELWVGLSNTILSLILIKRIVHQPGLGRYALL